MNEPQEQMIECMACKKEGAFDFYPVVNTMVSADLKARVKNYEIFKFTCPHCGSEQFVNYSFLYHDVKHRVLVYYCQDEEDAARAEAQCAETACEAGYRRRVVMGADNLVEKVRIFDAALDDRVVEIYKILLFGEMRGQLLMLVGGENVETVFLDEHADGTLYFVFVAGNQAVAEVQFDRGVYQEVARRYKKALENISAETLVVDQDWAFDFLSAQQEV
ncbi:MAG: CpXC domain-containing protein [Peptococcaceae bacterium]|nr:CpXC domain-containing protein [Peptococcaceae bacterium]